MHMENLVLPRELPNCITQLEQKSVKIHLQSPVQIDQSSQLGQWLGCWVVTEQWVVGKWTMDSGQWTGTVDSRQWTGDSGQWTVDSGQRAVDSAQRSVDSGQLAVGSGQ